MRYFPLVALGGCWLIFGYLPVDAAELQKFSEVRLLDNPANDGDSFVVQAGERRLHLRLYFVDCPESVATTDADAKRVREQARYFGIPDSKKILEFGKRAHGFTTNALSRPFTVHTVFAGAMGRSSGGRVYAFVTTADGSDLGQLLVERGLGRAYGARREGPRGESVQEIMRDLQKREHYAMLARAGAWAATDPTAIDKLRELQREEDREFKDILRESAGKNVAPGTVDINTASARELQGISGVGPTLATEIIAGRPYQRAEDLLRLHGVGARLFARIKSYVVVKAPPLTKPNAGD